VGSAGLATDPPASEKVKSWRGPKPREATGFGESATAIGTTDSLVEQGLEGARFADFSLVERLDEE
jgi:hypothetical protein